MYFSFKKYTYFRSQVLKKNLKRKNDFWAVLTFEYLMYHLKNASLTPSENPQCLAGSTRIIL